MGFLKKKRKTIGFLVSRLGDTRPNFLSKVYEQGKNVVSKQGCYRVLQSYFREHISNKENKHFEPWDVSV